MPHLCYISYSENYIVELRLPCFCVLKLCITCCIFNDFLRFKKSFLLFSECDSLTFTYANLSEAGIFRQIIRLFLLPGHGQLELLSAPTLVTPFILLWLPILHKGYLGSGNKSVSEIRTYVFLCHCNLQWQFSRCFLSCPLAVLYLCLEIIS